MIFCTIFLCTSIHFLIVNADVVNTHYGAVSGNSAVSRGGVKYYSFRGIPYAKPPVGDLRFKVTRFLLPSYTLKSEPYCIRFALDPQEPTPWRETKLATNYSEMCLQSSWDSTTLLGNEDCLYLNVFTPTLYQNTSLPVMVWIHGGAFLIDSGSIYSPHYIMDKPIVFVTFNYRLGALGFLYSGDENLSGNLAMKDQVKVLQWVRQNIRNFGGDPSQVTLAGQSAGGASVHLHMHSQLSKGLFHRAIIQSGIASSSWALIPSYVAQRRFFAFATLLGCVYESSREIVECLKDVSSEELMKRQLNFEIWHRNPMYFGVVIESHRQSAFITVSPWKSNALNPNIPLIIGFTSDEGANAVLGLLENQGRNIKELSKNYKRLLPILAMYQTNYGIRSHAEITNVTEAIKSYYFGEKPIDIETFAKLKMMLADAFLTFDQIETLLKYQGRKYFYIYEHKNEHSFAELEHNPLNDNGPVHCDDLISLFPFTYFPENTNIRLMDRQISELMVNLWTNFVMSGNPNDLYQPSIIWKPTTKELEFYSISDEPRMKSWNWRERYSFWKNLRSRYGTSTAEPDHVQF